MTLVGMEETEKQGLLTVHRPMKKPNWFYLLERNGHQNAVDEFLGAFREEVPQRPGIRTEPPQQAERTPKRGHPEMS